MSSSWPRGRRPVDAPRGRRNAALFVVLLAVLAIVRNGVGLYPGISLFATELAPMWPELPTDRPPLSQFALWSPLGPAIAHVLGVDSIDAYAWIHVVVLVIGIGAVASLTLRSHGRDAARTMMVIVALAPAMTVLLTWTGVYDVFTVILALLLVAGVSNRWAVGVGVLLATCALEQGAIILISLMAVAVAGVWGDVRNVACAAGGLLVGGTVVLIWLRAQGVRYGRGYWVEELGFGHFWGLVVDSWPLLVLSAFGVLWPLVVLVARASRGRQRHVALVVLAIPVVPMMLAEDATRVFGVVSIAPLAALSLARTADAPDTVRRGLMWAVLLGCVPGFVVWQGVPHLADWGPWTVILGSL